MEPHFFVFCLGCQSTPQYPVPNPPTDLTTRPQNPADPKQRLKCRHILIQYKGALSTNSMLERSRLDAYQQAYAIYLELQNGGNFASLAQRNSDDPSSNYGGELPTSARGSLDPFFEDIAYALKVNEISPPTETAFGWHIIQRQENDEGQFVHILISYANTRDSQSTRTAKEAYQLMTLVKTEILNGEDPEAIASKYSDGPAGSRGGMLGWLSSNELHPVFKSAAFSTQSGQLSKITESPYGYHLFVRYK